MLLVYKTGLVEQIDELRTVSNGASLDTSVHETAGRGRADDVGSMMKDARDAATAAADGTATVINHEMHEELWKSLSPNHWPTLFAFYNMSLTGRSVTWTMYSIRLFHMFKLRISHQIRYDTIW